MKKISRTGGARRCSPRSCRSARLAPATLDSVKQKGFLQCGSNTGLAGFGLPDDKGNWTGLDVDVCRAVAAAIFNDPTKVKFVPLTAKDRFTALQSGEVDVLSRNTTWTMSRDTSLGLNFAGVNYYDGQGFMVRKKLGVASALELNGASVCIAAGHDDRAQPRRLSSAPTSMKYEVVAFATADETVKAYEAGRCDVFTTDASGLYAERLKLGQAGRPHRPAGDHLQGAARPGVRQGDDQWFDIVNWTLFRHAQRRGTRRDQGQCRRDAEVRQSRRSSACSAPRASSARPIGLTNDWAYRIIKHVGNYGESLRAQRRRRLAAEDRARPERAVDQGRPAVRAADPLIGASTTAGAAIGSRAGSTAARDAAGTTIAVVGQVGIGIMSQVSRACRAQTPAAQGIAAQRPAGPRASSTRSSLVAVIGVPVLRGRRQRASRTCSAQKIASGFGFWNSTAGFDISQTLIPYSAADGRPTATPSGSACSTRCSSPSSASSSRPSSASSSASRGCRRTGSCRELARGLCRDHPQHPAAAAAALLVHRRAEAAARARATASRLPGGIFLNKRGLFVPEPHLGPSRSATSSSPSSLGIVGDACVLAAGPGSARMRPGQQSPGRPRRARPDRRPAAARRSVARRRRRSTFDLPAAGPLQLHRRHAGASPNSWRCCSASSSTPAAFIAEIVRAGILAVSHGQTEAAARARPARRARRCGWSSCRRRMRVIIPPLTSQYLNLTKNSSLAVAIGYPDLVQRVRRHGAEPDRAGDRGHRASPWRVYLTISLVTSLLHELVQRAHGAGGAVRAPDDRTNARHRSPAASSGKRDARRRPAAAAVVRGRAARPGCASNLFAGPVNTLLTLVLRCALVAVARARRWSGSCSSTRSGAARTARPAAPSSRPAGRRLLGLRRATASATSSTAPIRVDRALAGRRRSSRCWRHRRRLAAVAAGAAAGDLGAAATSSSCCPDRRRFVLLSRRRRALGPAARRRHATCGAACCVTLVMLARSASSSRCRSASCWRSAGARSCRSSRLLCVIFIEFVRGVPLITVLFMATVMLPLFVPRRAGGRTSCCARWSASRCSPPPTWPRWCAAACRRCRKGQYEGAMSLGLGYWQMMRLDHPAAGAEDRHPRHRQHLHRPVQGHDAGRHRRHLRLPARRSRRARIDPNWAAPDDARRRAMSSPRCSTSSSASACRAIRQWIERGSRTGHKR